MPTTLVAASAEPAVCCACWQKGQMELVGIVQCAKKAQTRADARVYEQASGPSSREATAPNEPRRQRKRLPNQDLVSVVLRPDGKRATAGRPALQPICALVRD
mmetsp:Transcript_76559/g.224728  ORF Transcript_76559/g.224728 Transcript_76559/m.224728 type:complete len:103 (+) Transcript_76559:681-989(+)